MTTIAFKDGVIAADSQVNDRGTIIGFTEKVFRIDGHIFGLAGGLAECGRIREWAKTRDGEFPECDGAEGYWIKPSGEFLEISGGAVLQPIKNDFCAIGTGSDLALGAMAAGATAIKAVSIACAFDQNTGGEITSFEV